MSFKERIVSGNEKLAVTVTLLVGTMAFFYLCNVLVIIPLLIPAALPTVQFISSGWLQLILLPVLLIGQNILSDRQKRDADAKHALQEQRALEDHEHMVAIHDFLFARMTAQDELLAKLCNRLPAGEDDECPTMETQTHDLRSMHARGHDRFNGIK